MMAAMPYSMTSVGAGLDDQQMQDLLASFGHLEAGAWCHLNLILDVDGQAVIGSPTRMLPEEEALCI